MANPRQNESFAGARFNYEFVLNVFDEDNTSILKFLKAMQLLEDDYLGGQVQEDTVKLYSMISL